MSYLEVSEDDVGGALREINAPEVTLGQWVFC